MRCIIFQSQSVANMDFSNCRKQLVKETIKEIIFIVLERNTDAIFAQVPRTQTSSMSSNSTNIKRNKNTKITKETKQKKKNCNCSFK